MVDTWDEQYNLFQQRWIDYIDTHETPFAAIEDAINKLNSASSHPWLHPNKNMAWLWDWLLQRKSELMQIIPSAKQ